LIIFVIFFNINFKPKNAFLFTVLCAAVKDIFGLARFGTAIISFIICGMIVNKIKAFVYHNDKLSQIIIVFLVAFVNSLIFYLLNLVTIKLSFFSSLFFVIVPETLYTAVLGPLIFQGLKRCVSRSLI
jgi:rod shape-determining protein MreD